MVPPPPACDRLSLAREARGDPFCRVPIAVEDGAIVGHPGGGDGSDDRVRVVVDENVGAHLDSVGPFGRRSERDARYAVPVRLLLEPAGVGQTTRADEASAVNGR